MNFQNNKGQLRQLEFFVIDLARLWFSGENFRREVDRNLNVKFGYFNGCRASLSINNMFSFILFYKSVIVFNPYNCTEITNDEKCIAELIFPSFGSDKGDLTVAQNFVPKAETVKLVRLAQMVSCSLDACS